MYNILKLNMFQPQRKKTENKWWAQYGGTCL